MKLSIKCNESLKSNYKSSSKSKSAGLSAVGKPHVVFGAWRHPKHGVSFDDISGPLFESHRLGMMHGICNKLVQINKIGQILLGNSHQNGVLNNKHYWNAGTRCVLKPEGIRRLFEHHDIDPMNSLVEIFEVANRLSGQCIHSNDMPGDIAESIDDTV